MDWLKVKKFFQMHGNSWLRPYNKCLILAVYLYVGCIKTSIDVVGNSPYISTSIYTFYHITLRGCNYLQIVCLANFCVPLEMSLDGHNTNTCWLLEYFFFIRHSVYSIYTFKSYALGYILWKLYSMAYLPQCVEIYGKPPNGN